MQTILRNSEVSKLTDVTVVRSSTDWRQSAHPCTRRSNRDHRARIAAPAHDRLWHSFPLGIGRKSCPVTVLLPPYPTPCRDCSYWPTAAIDHVDPLRCSKPMPCGLRTG